MSRYDGAEVAAGIIGVLFAAILGFGIVAGSFLYGVFSAGYVGMKLWTWYIVPVFGLPTLKIVQAWGIALLASLWTHQNFTNTNEDKRTTEQKIVYSTLVLISPWLTLLVGWIGTFFL